MDTLLPPMNPEVARIRRQSAQRRYRKRMRYVRLLWMVAGVLLMLLTVEIAIAFCVSPRFWVWRIQVTGAETLTEAQVIRLVNLPEHSSYYRARLGGLAARVRAEQRVADATVRRGAVGELIVNVRERQAVCRLGHGQPPLYLDADGYLFTRPVQPARPVPVVEGLQRPAARQALGKVLRTAHTRDVLACLAALHKGIDEKMAGQVARLMVDGKGRITLVLRQGTRIFVGTPHDLATKMLVLNETIIQASAEGYSLDKLDYISVEDPLRAGAHNRDREEYALRGYFHPKDEQEATQP